MDRTRVPETGAEFLNVVRKVPYVGICEGSCQEPPNGSGQVPNVLLHGTASLRSAIIPVRQVIACLPSCYRANSSPPRAASTTA
jgi:hypothetical protein